MKDMSIDLPFFGQVVYSYFPVFPLHCRHIKYLGAKLNGFAMVMVAS